MPVIVSFVFPFQGPFGSDMLPVFKDLAASINQEPGFLWKIWTECRDSSEAGGIYLFADQPSAKAYVAKHSARLAAFGIKGIEARVLEVNESMTALNHGPIGSRK